MNIQPEPQAAMLAVMQDMLAEMKRQRTQSDELWDADAIATYMKLEKSTVQQRILRRPNFPAPVILPTSMDGSSGGKRWVAKEVRAWALRHKQS